MNCFRKQAPSADAFPSEPAPNALLALPRAIPPVLSDDDELGDDFWGAVDYCAYLRCAFEGGGGGGRRVFVNGAYARLVGVSRDEIMQRWGRCLDCTLDSDDALLSFESIRTAAEPSKSRHP